MPGNWADTVVSRSVLSSSVGSSIGSSPSSSATWMYVVMFLSTTGPRVQLTQHTQPGGFNGSRARQNFVQTQQTHTLQLSQAGSRQSRNNTAHLSLSLAQSRPALPLTRARALSTTVHQAMADKQPHKNNSHDSLEAATATARRQIDIPENGSFNNHKEVTAHSRVSNSTHRWRCLSKMKMQFFVVCFLLLAV